MYVADSLFFIQHLYTDEKDENHGTMFGMKLRDIFQQAYESNSEPKQSAEDIKNRMIAKSKALSGIDK